MLRVQTAGESHGQCLTAWVSGLPLGVPVAIDFNNRELQRRQAGYGRGGRMKIERDRVQILSGVRHGKTIGAPITLQIANRIGRIGKTPCRWRTAPRWRKNSARWSARARDTPTWPGC